MSTTEKLHQYLVADGLETGKYTSVHYVVAPSPEAAARKRHEENTYGSETQYRVYPVPQGEIFQIAPDPEPEEATTETDPVAELAEKVNG